jgi:hypothetical protein
MLFILALLVGVSVVVAQPPDHMNCHNDVHTVIDEDTDIPVTMFTDCRLNNTDLAAPVVIYYTWDVKPVLDENGNQMWGEKGGLVFEDVITGIDVNMIDLETGFINNALHVSADEIASMVADQGGTDCCLAANGGVSLNYSESGWFWVAAPDREGKPYTFQWEGFNILEG